MREILVFDTIFIVSIVRALGKSDSRQILTFLGESKHPESEN